MLEALAFYGLATLVLGGAVACVLARDIVRCAVGLLGALIGVAGLFLLLGAVFAASVQLIVYAGGVLVLIIFGIMLTSRGPGASMPSRWNERIGVGIILSVLIGGLLYAVSSPPPPPNAPEPRVSDVRTIGESLLTTWLLPFELVSVLLLAVLIGAAHLARPARGS